MIDPITFTIAIGAIIVSILSHIRHSKCLNCIEVDTRSPTRTTPNNTIG